MTTHKLILTPVVALLVSLGDTTHLRADAPTGAPVVVITGSSGGCATCETIAPASGHSALSRLHRTPRQTTICPGSCFGYFPAQWRKWDDACLYQQPGVILTEPHPTTPYPLIPPASDRLPTKNGTTSPPLPGPRIENSPTRIK